MRGRTPVVMTLYSKINGILYSTSVSTRLSFVSIFFTRTVVVRHIVRVVPRAAPRTRTGPSHPFFACVGKQPNLGGRRWGRLHFCISLEYLESSRQTAKESGNGASGRIELQTSNIEHPKQFFPCAVTCNQLVLVGGSRAHAPAAAVGETKRV